MDPQVVEMARQLYLEHKPVLDIAAICGGSLAFLAVGYSVFYRIQARHEKESLMRDGFSGSEADIIQREYISRGMERRKEDI